MKPFSDIVILCVGTNKLIGDSVGPIVGQKLARLLKNKQNVWIYGNTKRNLNLKNAKQILKQIQITHKQAFVITIDAALGPKEMIENTWIGSGIVKIGEALDKQIQYFSNITIKGIVGEYQNNLKQDYQTLNEVNRNRIHRLSNKITYEVCQIIEQINCV